MLIGVFAATDVFLFYVFFEAMLIPMYFIIGSRRHAAIFVRGTEVLAVQPVRRPADAGRGDRALCRSVATRSCTRRCSTCTSACNDERWLFLGFFVAFAIKAPLWPFHTWLPDAAAESPVGGTVLLVGVLDKVGTFGFLRYCLELFPNAVALVHAGGADARGHRGLVRRTYKRSARRTCCGWWHTSRCRTSA